MSFFGIAHLQEQQLRDDQVRHHVVHRRAQEHDSIHQQTRVDVITPLAPPGLLHHHRHQEIIHKYFRFYRRNLTEQCTRVKSRASRAPASRR